MLIVGNMTGNSMDAIDLVLTEFDGDKMRDVATYTKPYSKEMQEKMEELRALVKGKSKAEILQLKEFDLVHDEYIRGVADCINEMISQNGLDKTQIDAIGFHGKTLDHFPPSVAKKSGDKPYTLQIGSGKMLADLTGVKVVYDFRSAPLMNGFEGAPLIPPHNAHIAATEGDGIYYNGGNTSNFALIANGEALLGADAGPFNEYVDNFIRQNKGESFDKDGKYGLQGKLDVDLLQKLFDIGRDFYELKLPKSGDPAYYHKEDVFGASQGKDFCDVMHTFEYFSAYVAVQALSLIEDKSKMNGEFVLFGGGWKNPVVRSSFEALLKGEWHILPEHQEAFGKLSEVLGGKLNVRYSGFGEYMEARLFADLARYYLEGKAWEIPEVVKAGQKVVCGVSAKPDGLRHSYDDKINLAAKGW